MTSGEGWIAGFVIVGLVIGLGLLWVAWQVIVGGFVTALSIFAWASEYGFIGIALYVLLWVVAFPVMLIICLIGGIIALVAVIADSWWSFKNWIHQAWEGWRA